MRGDRGRERRLRVAYDAGPLLDLRTGVGRYTRELADILPALGVDLRPYAVAARGRAPEGVRRWRVPARLAQACWRAFERPPITVLSGPADLVHATNFVLPALGSVPGVVTVHDLSYQRGDTFPGGERLRELVPWSLRRAAMILTPTEAIRREVCEVYGVPPERVRVTYEGVSPLFFGATPLSAITLAEFGITPPFAVAVGTIEPRKNLPRLLHAWRGLREEFREHMLVIAGPKGWGPELPEVPDVRLLGWVGDETLPGLLAAADVFCYPSLYEGFGLPPLEAMAAGTATVVGNYSAAREVVGEGALVVDATDVEALAGGLARLLGDERARADLARAGRARATEFSWTRTGKSTLASYQEAAAA